MGRNQVTMTIMGTTSSHNSINDELDAVRWRWLCREIKELIDRPEYKELSLDLSFDQPYAGPYLHLEV